MALKRCFRSARACPGTGREFLFIHLFDQPYAFIYFTIHWYSFILALKVFEKEIFSPSLKSKNKYKNVF